MASLFTNLLLFRSVLACESCLNCDNLAVCPLFAQPVPRYAQKSQTLTCDQMAQGFTYDPASQVTNILHQLGATGPTINQAAYTYNGLGNRASLTDRRGSQAFGYNNLDRLTSASHPLLGTPQAFAYDAVGV